MRPLVPVALALLTACSSVHFATTPPHATTRVPAAEGVGHGEDGERFDRPDVAAEFYAMKRGITPGMDVAKRYAAARARIDEMSAYSTVEGRIVTEHRTGRAMTDAVSERTIPSSWTFLGPGNIGGRTRVLVFDPTDPSVMYSGGVSGGVWKTVNGGLNWGPIGDALVNLAVNAMIIDPHDARTLYVGTGEGYFREDVRGTALPIRGDGIFVTHDGGTTWTQLPATASNPDFQWVNKLVMSPHDSHRIYAATRSGVWRSVDSGTTWTNVLPTTVKGGAIDLAMRSDTAGDYLFASCGIFEQATVYRNKNAEGSGGWEAVLSDPGMSRTSLAIAPSNPSIMYALAASNNPGPDGSTQNLQAVYRSDQNGDAGSWTAQVRVTDPDKLNALILSNPVSALQPQCSLRNEVGNWVPMGWHCNVIAVDPVNPDRVWAAGVDLFRSDDGGKTWGVGSYWWIYNDKRQFVHADQHVIAFDPRYDGAANKRMYVTNDGGVYRTDDATAAVAHGVQGGCSVLADLSWTSLVHNYGTTQFYYGAVSADGKQFAGGAQDNGTPHGSLSGGTETWTREFGGDGGYTAFDPVAPRLFVEAQNANIVGIDLNTDESWSVKPPSVGSDAHYLFITPFSLDPNDHTRLWVGGDRMIRCDPSSTGMCVAASEPQPDLISALAIDPTNSDHMIAGTNTGRIISTDTAKTATTTTVWSSRTPRAGFVSSIVYDPLRAGTLYATYAGFGGGAHVWRSLDGGSTWTAIDGSGAASIPDIPVHSIAPDPTRPGRLYLGTDLGIFVSLDDGDHWMSEASGLPQVITERVTIARGLNGPAIYAFTHGRGLWRAELTVPGPRRRAIGR